MTHLPAIAFAAVPGRRAWTLELAREAEARGFAGLYCASFGDCMSLCLSLAHVTETMPFGTAVMPIYHRRPADLAAMASYIHELSGGRFHLGIGVSHEPMRERLNVQAGKPLSDIREYVAAMRAAEPQAGQLPPIVLATLRRRMVQLSDEIAEGAVWANASRSHLATSLAHIPAAKRDAGFFIGNMLPTCIDDDREAAAAVCRRNLIGYVTLPNYRNYWKEAGYVEEMEAIEQALDRGERERLTSLMTDRWLADCTLFGSAAEVRDGIEQWHAAGMKTPILVPSSTSGGQAKAFQEIFEAFA